jgi:hypothetical protein
LEIVDQTPAAFLEKKPTKISYNSVINGKGEHLI